MFEANPAAPNTSNLRALNQQISVTGSCQKVVCLNRAIPPRWAMRFELYTPELRVDAEHFLVVTRSNVHRTSFLANFSMTKRISHRRRLCKPSHRFLHQCDVEGQTWFVACSFPDDFGVVLAERGRQEQQSVFSNRGRQNVVFPLWGVVFPLLFFVGGVSSVFVCLLVSLFAFLFLQF